MTYYYQAIDVEYQSYFARYRARAGPPSCPRATLPGASWRLGWQLTRVELEVWGGQGKCGSGRLGKFAKVGSAEENARNFPAPMGFEVHRLLWGLSDLFALSWV